MRYGGESLFFNSPPFFEVIMKILGLDPSLTNFGWAIYDGTTCVDKGRFQTPASMQFIDRYVYMRESLIECIKEHSPDRVGIEYPVFNNLWSEGMYGLFLYCSEALKIAKKDVVFFSPNQIKAHAKFHLGRPIGWKMMKGDMVEACKKHANIKKSVNHNEADAYWVAVASYSFWSFYEGDLDKSSLNSVELQQFTKTHTYIRGKKQGTTEKKGIIYRESERFFLWSEV